MLTDSSINIPFRTQQFLLRAAQTGSFHQAAKSFGVHPSVLARHIHRLENDLGVKLIDRDRNLFSMTGPGEFFLREIQQSMHHAARAWDLARYRARIEYGPFRLGYSPYVHSRLLPVLEQLDLGGFTRQYTQKLSPFSGDAEVRFVLEAGGTTQLMEGVLCGKLHASLGIQPILEEDLWVRPIVREPFCLCVSKNHRLAKQPSVFVKDLDGEMVFFLPRTAHPGFYDGTLEYVQSTGARPVWKEVIWFTHAMEIVAHNFGVALLPRSAARHAHMGVLFKPVTDKLLRIETALFFRKDRQNEGLLEILHGLLLQLKQVSPE